MAQTNNQLPLAVIPNTTPGIDWLTPNNILLVDDRFAVATGSTQILTVGNFPINLQQGDQVTNIVVSVKGYRGSFNTTLQIFAVDDTSGLPLSYPLLPAFQGFNGVNTLWTLPATLFATTWTINQINNIKIKMIADGELHLDSVELNVIYTPVSGLPVPLNYSNLAGSFIVGETITGQSSGTTAIVFNDNGLDAMEVTGTVGVFLIGETIIGGTSGASAIVAAASDTGQTVCDEFVQAQRFQLSQSMTSASLFMSLSTFNYPNGDPIQFADFYGADALVVVDQGIPGKEENIRITAVDQNYQGTGICRISFGTLSNRGLAFHWPYTSDPNNRQDHNGTAEVVISNSAPFYDRFLKKCQIDALVSAPITVLDEDVPLTNHVHSINIKGSGATATAIGDAVTITIPGAGGTTPPTIVSSSSATSGNVQVPTLGWNHTSIGIDRDLKIEVSLESGKTVTGITYNSIPLVFVTGVSSTGPRSEIWNLVAPPVGTYPIVITFSAASYCSAGAQSFIGVDQSTPTGTTQTATGNNNSPTLILNTTYDNSIIVDGLSTALTPIIYTAGAGQVVDWNHSTNTDTRQGAGSYELSGTAPDPVTMSWAMTQSTFWALTAVEIKGITSTVTSAGTVYVDGSDTTQGFLDAKIEIINGINTTVVKTIQNPGANEKITYQINASGGGGGGGNYVVDQTPDNGTYGLLAGAVDGINTTFTVSQSAYVSGSLVVSLNGLVQFQGPTDDFQETTPGSGTFDFNTPPLSGDIITAIYQTANTIAQPGIQFEDEGVPLGTPGTVDELDFVGSNVAATRVGNKVTVTVTGGSGGSGISEQNLGGIGVSFSASPQSTELESFTSETDGSVVYACFREDNHNPVLVRYERDANTGFYNKTHELLLGVTGNTGGSLAVIGSFLYVVTQTGGGAMEVQRFLAADLTGGTAMIETPAVNISGTGAMFTNGTDLFIKLVNGVGTWTRYTISGTTLTAAGTFTGGRINAATAFQNGSDVWMVEKGSPTIGSYTYGGGTFTLNATKSYQMGNMGNISGEASSFPIGLIPINSSIFFVGFIATFRGFFSSTGSANSCENLIIKPFTIV